MNEKMRLLLISNSTNAGEEYLAYPMPYIAEFLAGVRRVCFIPFAGVTFTHDAYRDRVGARFDSIGIGVDSVHASGSMHRAVEEAEAIVVGGGNTWRLLDLLQRNGLLPLIRQKVLTGTPYVGWSAGSNVACPSIRTTNDMPIVQPSNFEALGLVPFQINPHYLDANPAGHAGETREDRIMEFIELNGVWVVGLREGTMLRAEGGVLSLVGPRSARVFRRGESPREVEPGASLQFLLQ